VAGGPARHSLPSSHSPFWVSPTIQLVPTKLPLAGKDCGSFAMLLRMSGKDLLLPGCVDAAEMHCVLHSPGTPVAQTMVSCFQCHTEAAWTHGSPSGSKGVLVVTMASGQIVKGAAHCITCVYGTWVLLIVKQVRALTSSSGNKHKLQEFIKLSKNDNTSSEELLAQTHLKIFPAAVQNPLFSSSIWRNRARKLEIFIPNYLSSKWKLWAGRE